MAVTTRQVLLSCIRKRLNSCGFVGSRLNCIRDVFAGLPVDPSEAVKEIGRIGKQIEEHTYHSAFLDMAMQKFECGDQSKRSYMSIVSEIFSDREINWGRLVLAFVYTGRLAVRAITNHNNPCLARELVDWCESFFTLNYLDQWVQANGGWDAMPCLSATDWDRREIELKTEMRDLTVGFSMVAGLIMTAYYVLQR